MLIRLSEFDNIYERRCCESSFLFYHYSKKHQKQRVFSYFVTENKFGAATFFERLDCQGTFTFWKELYCLFHKSLLIFVNCEGH